MRKSCTIPSHSKGRNALLRWATNAFRPPAPTMRSLCNTGKRNVFWGKIKNVALLRPIPQGSPPSESPRERRSSVSTSWSRKSSNRSETMRPRSWPGWTSSLLTCISRSVPAWITNEGWSKTSAKRCIHTTASLPTSMPCSERLEKKWKATLLMVNCEIWSYSILYSNYCFIIKEPFRGDKLFAIIVRCYLHGWVIRFLIIQSKRLVLTLFFFYLCIHLEPCFDTVLIIVAVLVPLCFNSLINTVFFWSPTYSFFSQRCSASPIFCIPSIIIFGLFDWKHS